MPGFCVSCTVSRSSADDVVAIGYALGMQGCHEEEGVGGVRLHLYFNADCCVGVVEHALFRVPLQSAICIETVVDEDWNSVWKSTITPVTVAPGYVVAPGWLEPPLATGEHWLRIEPGMAFGTGHHETTRLAAGALLRCIDAVHPASVLDVGTGSGILCFCAAHRGVAQCVGVECDPCCRENLARNRRDNDTDGHTRFVIGFLDALDGEGLFACAVMNMISTHAQPCLGPLARLLAPAAPLVWSGILDEDHTEAVEAAQHQGFTLTQTSCENEWWCGVFRAPGHR